MTSAGLPAPSHTTTSKRPASSSYAAWAASASPPRPPANSVAPRRPAGRPRTTTWLTRSLPGLSSTGFIADSGSARAANACTHCARPISAPSAVTIELFDMFCALNGATDSPRRAKARHSAVVTTVLPASEVVPATRRLPMPASCQRPGSARERPASRPTRRQLGLGQ